MFGNFIILASGLFAKFPNSDKSSETCCSFGRLSENAAKMRWGNEISLISKFIFEDAVKCCNIGRSDCVAKAGASSVLV